MALFVKWNHGMWPNKDVNKLLSNWLALEIWEAVQWVCLQVWVCVDVGACLCVCVCVCFQETCCVEVQSGRVTSLCMEGKQPCETDGSGKGCGVCCVWGGCVCYCLKAIGVYVCECVAGDGVWGLVHVGCACEKAPLCGGHIERGSKTKTPVFTLERCCNKAGLWFTTSKRCAHLIHADSLSILQPHVAWDPNGLETVGMMWSIWENSVGCMPELNAPDVFFVSPQLLCVGSSATHAFHSKSVTHLLYHSVAGSSSHTVPDRDRTTLGM